MQRCSIVANEHLAIIKKVDTYGKALANKKETYLQKYNDAASNSQDQAQAYDAVFILDYMIETNKQMIVYLSFFQNTNNTLVMKARDDLFGSIENIADEDIYIFVERIRQQILSNKNEVVNALKNLSWLLMFVQTSSLATIVIIPVLLSAFLLGALAGYATLAILAVLAVVTAINSYVLSKYKPELRAVKENLIDPLSILKDTDHQKIIDTHSIFTTGTISSETIRNSFFSHKVSNNAPIVKDDVALEYHTLVAH